MSSTRRGFFGKIGYAWAVQAAQKVPQMSGVGRLPERYVSLSGETMGSSMVTMVKGVAPLRPFMPFQMGFDRHGNPRRSRRRLRAEFRQP